MARISFVLDLLDSDCHLVPGYIGFLYGKWTPYIRVLYRRTGRKPFIPSGDFRCFRLGRPRNQSEGNQYRKVGRELRWHRDLDAFPTAHGDGSVRMGETRFGNTD